MQSGVRDQQTICAVSTPAGYGGISVLRVSGSEAYKIVSACSGKLPDKPESHHVYFTSILDAEKNPIDEVLVTFFQNGKSFTGEEVVEISCHGNPQICESILSRLILEGAVPADRGEFTYRAFMNNKLDLVQAESVLSLIESQSSRSRQLALRQLKGQLSERITKIEDRLVWSLAHLEASIDFSTEGLEVISDIKLQETISDILKQLDVMVSTYRQGKILKDGLRVALVGQPNVGKSSLLNLLCGESRAIVTPQAGTTRDLIEASVLFRGLKIQFVDTAGLRENAEDIVEQIGISKSREAMKDSDLIIFVYDSTKGLTRAEISEIGDLRGVPVLILGNKMDLNPTVSRQDLMKEMQNTLEISGFSAVSQVLVSAFSEDDKILLLQNIFDFSMVFKVENTAVLSQLRHFEGLNKALQFVVEAQQGIVAKIGSELIAIHLKEALLCVQEVLGKHFDDQILDRVFKEFCLGK